MSDQTTSQAPILSKGEVLKAINDRLIEIVVDLDTVPKTRPLGGRFTGVSFTIDVPRNETIRILVEAHPLELIPWMDHRTAVIYEMSGPRARFVTSCKMLPDDMHDGYFGMFPNLDELGIYYIQIN